MSHNTGDACGKPLSVRKYTTTPHSMLSRMTLRWNQAARKGEIPALRPNQTGIEPLVSPPALRALRFFLSGG